MRRPLNLGQEPLCRECIDRLDLVVNVRAWLPARLAAGQIETTLIGEAMFSVESLDDPGEANPVLKCPKCGEEYELPGEVIYR